MRFFPRDAFKSLPDLPVQIPIALGQFQHQAWQQTGMPMAALQVSMSDPFFPHMLQIPAHQPTHPMPLAFQGDLWWIHPQLSNLDWYLMSQGCFGFLGY
jgi:hypothetical protein